VLSLVPDFHQAEDILQQVAVVLVRRFHEYDSGRPFLPWALGIAKNISFECRREIAKTRVSLLDDELIDAVQAEFEADLEISASIHKALRNCLRQQQGRIREALRLRYAHDLKPQDVAQRMGINPGAVRVMLHRARESLRICIERSLAQKDVT
jgi:RNA polymerase sigma-70 factor (ECF subfamily)